MTFIVSGGALNSTRSLSHTCGYCTIMFCLLLLLLLRVIVSAGIDVTANQDDELTDKETFQMEFDAKREQWRVRTSENVLWKVADASGIQANDDGRSVTI